LNPENNKEQILSNKKTCQPTIQTEKTQNPTETTPNTETLLPQKTLTPSFRVFFKTNASSYLATLALAAASVTMILVFQNQDNLLRAGSGLLLALGLPGYALMKALFPPKTFRFEQQGRMGWLLTGAFSVVMSIIVVSLVAFALDLTPIGVNLVSLNLSLFTVTLFFGTVGLLRRYIVTKAAG
jgi:uncharacterized membrane protein